VSATGTIRRGQIGAVVAVVLTVLALAAIAGGPPSMPAAVAAPMPTEGCSWKRHSKQIVKRLRRHGKQRRVRRLKHWWTCEAQPSAFQPQPALPSPPSPATPSPGEPEPQLGHLGVKAVEYSYTLSRPEVGAGEVIVELNNQGEDPHNLVLEHEGSEDAELEIPSTPSLAQASAAFSLSSGTYRLYCSLYKHEAKGMEVTLVVGS
jgi:plastocyanin